jgi:hypothetical protein
MNCMFHQMLLGGQVTGGEKGGSCSTHGRDEKYEQYFGWEV